MEFGIDKKIMEELDEQTLKLIEQVCSDVDVPSDEEVEETLSWQEE